MNRLRIRRSALLLVLTAALAGCGSEPAPVPGNAPVPAQSATAAAPMPASHPEEIVVPAIGVDAKPLLDLGLAADGTLEVPPDAHGVGWYDESPTPGSLGPAIIAAHVDYAGVLGPFHKLHELKPGDEIRVRRADGTTAVFQTYQVDRYAKSSFPTEQVYGDTEGAEIRLITCGGVFDHTSGNYLDNVVAYAKLVATV